MYTFSNGFHVACSAQDSNSCTRARCTARVTTGRESVHQETCLTSEKADRRQGLFLRNSFSLSCRTLGGRGKPSSPGLSGRNERRLFGVVTVHMLICLHGNTVVMPTSRRHRILDGIKSRILSTHLLEQNVTAPNVVYQDRCP